MLCKGSVDLWFSEEPAEIEEAKRTCRMCPEQKHCFMSAAERMEEFGVWGGGNRADFKRYNRWARRHGKERAWTMFNEQVEYNCAAVRKRLWNETPVPRTRRARNTKD